jgi:prepilin-type N-terminal cleavage/methylation domain-containing protein
MKYNKGFTLIELLATIIILGIITIIAVPAVNRSIRNAKEELYKVQISYIEAGAKAWAAENVASLPENDGEMITLTLGQLKMAGFVDADIRNPKTKDLFPNDMEITITRRLNSYVYDVIEDSGTPNKNLDITLPTIILKGNAMEYTEFGEPFVDPGVLARSNTGVDISSQVTFVIKSNSMEVEEVDTSRFGQYKIIYTITENGKSATAIRTVIVRDTTPPELVIPYDTTITIAQVASFNAMAGVSATDNNGDEVDITVSGNVSVIPGVYTLTYTATDSKGNQTIKRRKITVTA